MSEDTFDIQQLVKLSGVPRRTIYFYVQQGLLPPPEGAGLAAYYTGQHLARLQLIPVLRQRGLRLDDIRQKFARMTPDELQQAAVARVDAAPPPAQSEFLKDERPPQTGRSLRRPQTSPIPFPQMETESQPAGRQFLHYALADEISLVAPADLSEPRREQVQRLLQAAAKIFTAGPEDGSNPQAEIDPLD